MTVLLAWPLWYGLAHGQTAPVVWSCNPSNPTAQPPNPAPCNLSGNTYNDGAFRPLIPKPVYVAATTGTNTNCATNWWNTSGAVRWLASATLPGNACVAIRTGNVESFAAASVLWPATPPPPPPPPVDCVVSEWSAWSGGEWGACRNRTQSRTETRTRTVVTPASNGGQACPALTETRTATQACSLSPRKWPHWANAIYTKPDGTIASHVQLKALVNTDPAHPEWNTIAMWFVQTSDGPKREIWIGRTQTWLANYVLEQAGLRYDEQAAADECEATCTAWADIAPATRAEADAFAAQFSAEQIGVIE